VEQVDPSLRELKMAVVGVAMSPQAPLAAEEGVHLWQVLRFEGVAAAHASPNVLVIQEYHRLVAEEVEEHQNRRPHELPPDTAADPHHTLAQLHTRHHHHRRRPA